MAKSELKIRSSLRQKRALLLRTGFILCLSGALAGWMTMIQPTPLAAQQITVPPVQMPDFSDLAEKVSAAVVSVRVRGSSPQLSNQSPPNLRSMPGSPMERFFREFGLPSPDQNRQSVGLGSGFFVSADGYVVTNNHVVANAGDLTVITDGGSEYKARLIGRDEKTDLAVLKVDANRNFPYVRLSSDRPKIGQWVIAVGNPFGLGGTVTAGIISGISRQIGEGPYDDYLQIDAPVNRGNSGGPSFNAKGEVVGINSAIYSPSGGNIGIAFAIPASTAQTVIEQLKAAGVVTRGWLGVQIQQVTDDIAQSLRLGIAKGALVAESQAGGPAAQADIRAGDVIISVNGKNVDTPRDLAITIASLPPNSIATVTVWREGANRDLAVQLGTLPADQQASTTPSQNRGAPRSSGSSDVKEFGLSLGPAADGAQITSVEPNGKAAELGLRQGDVIVSVGNVKVSQPADVQKAIAEAKAANYRAVLMRIKSGNGTRFVALPLTTG